MQPDLKLQWTRLLLGVIHPEIMSSLQMFQNSGIFCDVKSDIVRRQRQILR